MLTSIKLYLPIILITIIPLILSGCSSKNQKAETKLESRSGSNVTGTVKFTKEGNGIRIVADVKGLTPGKHGFHIHEFGDCSAADGTSAGGHFNPKSMQHSGPDSPQRHEGDMGNITADASGNARLDYTDPMMTFEGKNSIIGKSVIVHEKEDDLISQPTGNAGARVACGVIDYIR